MPTVLIADDEQEIVDLLRDYLLAEGFRVLEANDGYATLTLLDQADVDCVILDVMMPEVDGFDACKRIREQRDIPVLFLSARHRDVDRIHGLGLGGDDYVGKPFSPGEVVARVKALVRRYRRDFAASSSRNPIQVGALSIDPKSREVTVNASPVYLTVKEFDLLRFLVEHPRQVFTRDQLFERVWGDYGDLHTVTVHIARIREKIEPVPSKPTFITTVWGVGYRFEGE